MLTQEKIDQFFKDVYSLNLKFPVAELMRATGYGKGNVSDFLAKKKPVPEKFINAFYDTIGSTIKVPRETISPDLSTALRIIEGLTEAHIVHAKANADNAASLKELVVKISSDGTEKVSQPSQGEGPVKRDPVQQSEIFVGKSEIHSHSKTRKRKDTFSEKGK